MSLTIVPSSTVGGTGLANQETSIVVATQSTATGVIDSGGAADDYTGIASSDSTAIAHDTGLFVPAAGVVSAGNLGNHRIDQPMARAELGNFLTRDVLIRTVTDVSTDTIIHNFFPWRDWAANSHVADKLNNFNFIKGGIRVHGIVMGPPLASGLIWVTAIPTYEATTPFTIPITHCMMGINTAVDCSKSNSFEIKLPWIAASNWGNLTDDLFDSQWNVTFRVMTGVKASIADGCATTTVRIFCSPMSDFELSGPTFQSRLPPARNGGAAVGAAPAPSRPAPVPSQPTKAKEQLPDLGPGNPGSIMRDIGKKVVEKTGYKLSDWFQGGSVAAGFVAMYPPATVPAGIASVGMGMVAKGLDYFGLTRATTIVRSEDAFIRIQENVINADGSDVSRKAALFSTNVTSPSPACVNMLTQVDECSVVHQYAHMMWIGKYLYTVGDLTPDDHRIAVTPMLYTNLTGGNYQPIAAGYIGANFAHWRGDMKFLFYPVVSPVHRGSFQFIWQPVPAANTSQDLTNVSINVEVPIEPGSPYIVTIGYNNDYPMAYTDFYNINSDISGVDYATLNGYLIVRNLNPITGSACGDTVEMHVFAAAGENMEFAGPTGVFLKDGEPQEFGATVTTGAVFQAKVLGDNAQDIREIVLVPSSGNYPVDENLFGESIRSTRALMMKPSVTQFLEGNAYFLTDGSSIDATRAINHAPFVGGTTKTDWFQYFGSTFLGFAGAVRYKYVCLRRGDAGTDLFNVPMIAADYCGKGTWPVSEFSPVITDSTLSAAYTVPFYHNELYVPAYKDGLRHDNLQWMNGDVTSQGGETIGALYRSIDESARFVFWRGPNYFDPQLRSPQVLGPYYPIAWGASSGFARVAERDLSQNESDVKSDTRLKMTLDQYRARTGRREFKVKPSDA